MKDVQMSESGKIYAAISAIMSEVEPISKNRRNEAQRYNFRGIDDIYLALQQVMAKWGVFTVPEVLEERSEERVTPKGTAMIYRILKIKYRFYAGDGSFVDAVVIGESCDAGDKAANKSMSVAQKYAMLQVFCIPTEEPKDPENDSPELIPNNKKDRPETQAAQRQEPVTEKKEQSSQEVVPKILKAFADYGVTRVMLEEFLQNTRLESMTKDQTQMIRDVLIGFKAKELSVEQVFGKSKRTTDQLNQAFSS